MNDPKLKLAIARLLPEEIYIHTPTDGIYWNSGAGELILETEWLYVMQLVEQQFAKDDVLTEQYWLALYDSTDATRWPYDATFNQRALAILKVKGITV